jgi:hypothetical protein
MIARSVRFAILVLLVLLLLPIGAALAFQEPFNLEATQIDWWVVAGGGDRSVQGEIVLEDTIGQPVVGASQPGSPGLSAGYWVRQGSVLYLPVVRK